MSPKNGKLKKVFSWSLVLFWMIIIFWSSSISGSDLKFDVINNQQYDFISSLAHLFLYFVLTFLSIRAFLVSGYKIKKALVAGFLISIIFGFFDEWHQHWVPGREVHFSDWLLDLVGSIIMISFYKLKFFRKLKKEAPSQG